MSFLSPARPPAGGRPAAGSVLIVVLIVCLGLVSLALVFGHSMILAYRGSDDDLASRQSAHASEGAARYAEYLLTNVTNDGDLPDPTTYQSQAVPVGDAFFWFIGVPLPSDAQNVPIFRLVDEASKLNLNNASATILENLPGMTQDLAEAIVDWRSAGGTAASMASGAGAGISATAVKEAPFESVEELAQVDSGTDVETLYGNDTNLNHILDPWEDTGGGGQLNSGLLEYLTVFSREPKVRRDGTSRVSVVVTPPTSQNVGGHVVLTPSRGTGALSGVLNKYLPGRGTAILTAAFTSLATSGQANPKIRSVLELYIRGQMMASELGTVSPYLTMASGTYSVGLVNVNTASQTVLSCVPGMTWQLAGQLVAARSQLSAPSSDLSWVYPILGKTVCYAAGPYLTTRSYQVTADVASVGRNGHGYRRTQYVIDSSNVSQTGTSSTSSSSSTSTSSSTSGGAAGTTSDNSTAQIVYRRDLSSLGWAIGASARQTVFNNGGIVQ
jgi:DNA uptake protein ComE-like DNA-binding protein